MTRSEISFHVCEISTKIKTATISDISVNKVIKFIKNNPSHMIWSWFHHLILVLILILALTIEANFMNLPNDDSQGEYIVFICDKNNKWTPIAWNSSKLKRVSRSTLAAEMQPLSDGCDTAFFIQSMLKENIFTTSSFHINIQASTDNQSLHDAVKTTNLTLAQRLQVELSALREMYDRNISQLDW